MSDGVPGATVVGKEYSPVVYVVGREKILEYADVIGAQAPVHRDLEAARAAGFRDVVAPPMFCVVYSARALIEAFRDPELGIDLGAMVHGGQEFVWGDPVCAGDEITTTVRVAAAYERSGRHHYEFESVSTNQEGAEVVRGAWSNIVRVA